MEYVGMFFLFMGAAYIAGHIFSKVYMAGVERGIKEMDGRFTINIDLLEGVEFHEDTQGNVINFKDYRGKKFDRYS